MKVETKLAIIAALEDYMRLHNISASDVAKKTEVNQAYISNMRAGNFTMNAGNSNQVDISDKYFEKIARFIGYGIEKSYWEPVETAQMKRILATLEDAKEYGTTNVIIGETGSGKSYVTELFAKAHPIDCFVVTVGSQDNIGDLIEKICDKIHMTTEKTKSNTLRHIAKKLNKMRLDGHKPIVIFDESEYMKAPALCNMKELYDNLNGIASIVLLGTPQLTKHLDKMRKKDRDGIPQFYRRIKFGIRVLPSIDKTYRQFLTQEMDKGLMRFIMTNCENYGELHDVLVPAMREADRSGQPLTENLVRTILNMPNN